MRVGARASYTRASVLLNYSPMRRYFTHVRAARSSRHTSGIIRCARNTRGGAFLLFFSPPAFVSYTICRAVGRQAVAFNGGVYRKIVGTVAFVLPPYCAKEIDSSHLCWGKTRGQHDDETDGVVSCLLAKVGKSFSVFTARRTWFHLRGTTPVLSRFVRRGEMPSFPLPQNCHAPFYKEWLGGVAKFFLFFHYPDEGKQLAWEYPNATSWPADFSSFILRIIQR
ncbi:unnamed protein product [Scytosiphon promiscuus]